MVITSSITVWIWLAVFTACLMTMCGWVMCLVFRRRRTSVLVAICLTGGLLGCLAAADAVEAADRLSGNWSQLAHYAAVLGCSTVVLLQGSVAFCLIRFPYTAHRHWLTAGLLVFHSAATAGAGLHFFRLSQGHMDVLLDSGHDLQLEPVLHTLIVTDTGRELPVYRASYTIDLATCDQSSAASRDGTIMRETSPDDATNCHGWVFTGGKFLVSGLSVDLILNDNGYTLTEQPVAGDVIIYRSPEGKAVHTGVVRALLDDGTPLIESKWGVGGRFLHRPLDQIYSADFGYYHSPRRAEVSQPLLRNVVTLKSTSGKQPPLAPRG